MVKKLNGRLIFIYGSPKKDYNKLIKANFKLSLLGILMGIFLLPQLAYLSPVTAEKLIELTNRERQAVGLNSLTANQLLTKAAIQKGGMIIKTNTFKHNIDNIKFSSWVRDTGYNYSYVGENLALDFTSSEDIIEAWKNSPLHKKNLLNPYYQEIGISTLTGKFQGQETIVVVQIFGTPAFASVQPLAAASGLGQINLRFISPQIDLQNFQYNQAENLLTHSIINQELLPKYNDKFILTADNFQTDQANKFIIQPDYDLALNNFLIIFSFLTLVYLLIYLHYYYYFKINELISV